MTRFELGQPFRIVSLEANRLVVVCFHGIHAHHVDILPTRLDKIRCVHLVVVYFHPAVSQISDRIIGYSLYPAPLAPIAGNIVWPSLLSFHRLKHRDQIRGHCRVLAPHKCFGLLYRTSHPRNNLLIQSELIMSLLLTLLRTTTIKSIS